MREFINELFDISGEVINHYYHKRDYSIEEKSNHTPVTVADKMAEEVIRKQIKNRFPDHGIIGEEYGSERDDAEFVWVLDPIDGTIAFIHGVPTFVTLIALLRHGQPIYGGIHQPVAALRCIGNNEQAWFNGELTQMRVPKAFDETTLLATDIVNIARMHNKEGFYKLLDRVKLFRTWGDGFGYLLLASGKADIMLDAKMAPWDILPVIPVVRGAGGRITTFSGGDPVTGTSAVTSHKNIHEEVLSLVGTRKLR